MRTLTTTLIASLLTFPLLSNSLTLAQTDTAEQPVAEQVTPTPIPQPPQETPVAAAPEAEPAGSAKPTATTDQAGQSKPSPTNRVVVEGIAVEFKVTPSHPRNRPTSTGGDPSDSAQVFTQNDDVNLSFTITDTTTGSPATTLEPAAWVHPAQEESCAEKIRSFLTASLSGRAMIDLNIFYVLALNDDATITVVDPLFDYGNSRLLALVQLPNPGEDWVINKAQNRIYVSIPMSNKVVVVDTATWKIIGRINVGSRPTRLGLQPDEKFLWVGCDGNNEADPTSNVTVIDTETLQVVNTIPTGQGHHEIAFSPDNHYVFVTNKASGTLSVIDIHQRTKIKDIQTGRHPVAVAYTKLGNAAYVSNQTDGTVTVVDGQSHEVIRQIEADPGLGDIRFDLYERLGFLVNPEKSLLYIFDAATHRLIQSGEVGIHPDQISFTQSNAYIRSLGTDLVYMVPLAAAGKEGTPIPIVDFTGGNAPFGKTDFPSIADGIVQAPGGISVLVANPADKMIYFYREGMAAPMGSYQNYSREPRAVLVVDRSLQETSPGVYATDIKLTESGKLDVAFFLDAPRFTHCFELDVQPQSTAQDPILNLPPMTIKPVDVPTNATPGQKVQVRFAVTDPKIDEPLADLKDMGVLVFAPGNWQQRLWGKSLGNGHYVIEFTPPKPGAYFISFHCPSKGLRLNDQAPVVILVKNKG